MSNQTSNQTQPETPKSGTPKSGTPKSSATGRIALIAALLGAVVFVCLNIVSAQVFRNARVDLTQQHLYSLSQGTRTMLGDLKEPVRFRLFMSSGLTKQAPQLAAFAGRVRSLLDSYAAAAKGNIILEVIDPRPFSEEEDRAVAFGIDGFTGTGGERLFFGLAATNSTTGRATIGVFAPDREAFLEYDLTRLVSELGRRGKPVVALLDGLGLAGNPMMRIPEQQVLTQMKQFFDVQPLSGDVEKLPDNTRVLMVVHPQDLSEKTLFTIDQWVMAGNATMIFVDPFAENQSGPRGGPPPNPTSNLEPLFKAWGVKFDTTRAIGDPDYALQTERNVGGRPVASQNLPWMALRGDALARDEAILAQLSAIVMTTAGAFETTKDGVTLQPLVRASNAAVTVNALIAGDRNQDPRRLLVELTKAPKPPILAARLTGTLDSAYPDGLKKEEKKPDEATADEKKTDEAKPEAAKADESKKDEAKAAENTLKKSVKPANVILVGDADMLMDRNWIQTHALFGQQVAQAFANNGDFVINAIEQMSGGAALSDLRGRGVSWRPFELIQRMEAKADSRFRAKERELTVQLQETEQKLSKLPKAAEGSNEVLTAEQAKTIEGFRTQLLAIRSELRDVQFALRRDVDNLKNVVTALNVGVVPVTVGFIALAFGLRRPRRPLPKRPSDTTA
ncbi:MAG TPA: Gldg family protein [Xanthobacteraceae bacterium]|nr:Gldg family protein [Xanthobacteraceae bacterium]